MTQQFQVKARLHSIIPVRRATNEIIFVSHDVLTEDFRKLASKLIVLHIAGTNGHIVQEPLPLAVEPQEKPVSETFIIKGQPIGKPRMTGRDRFLTGDRTRPCVARYWAWCDKAREAVGDRLPPAIDGMTVRFYFAMPSSWSAEKRLQMDGKTHHEKPDIDNCAKGCMDSLLANDEIVAELHASKRWTNGEPRTEVTFF